jgi:biotin-(acetyl-CoA carboxylase) ligase
MLKKQAQGHREMPLSRRSLDLPPPYRAVALREAGDAFAHALAHAGALGAGTLVFVGRPDVAEFAVVLEPEEPLAGARRAFYAGMVALVDTLAALAPPETPIAVAWPDAVQIGGALVGGGRLASPAGTGEEGMPDWLVFGAVIRLTSAPGEDVRRPSTTLEDEGFAGIDAEDVIAGFARHLMAALDRWRDGDFASIATDYLARMPREAGVGRAIEANGDLSIEGRDRSAARRALRPALAAPSWLDPATGEPRW